MTQWGFYLQTMRERTPLVQNITNYVSMNVMANIMLAAGASPAMVHAEEEAAEFAGFTQALTINIGTLSNPWVSAMLAAASVASEKGTPWVLDPVAGGATAFRRNACAELLALRPTVIKGNASEVLALAGVAASAKGVDAADDVANAEESAKALAASTGAVVAVTGAQDFVTDGSTSYRVKNGDAMMPLVTALGCSLGGVIAAFCVGSKPLEATVAAIAYYGLAGEIAAAKSAGPGSFAAAFVDALHEIDAVRLSADARIETA